MRTHQRLNTPAQGDLCPEHGGMARNIVCRTCSALVCLRCLVGKHFKHDYEELSRYEKQCEMFIAQGLKSVEERCAQLMDWDVQLEKQQQMYWTPQLEHCNPQQHQQHQGEVGSVYALIVGEFEKLMEALVQKREQLLRTWKIASNSRSM